MSRLKKSIAGAMTALCLISLAPRAEAAVLVYDAQNVEQAIRLF